MEMKEKGNILGTNLGAMTIDQLMAEADELMRKINTDAIKDMEEVHRLEFEKHAQNFKKIRTGIPVNPPEKDASKSGSGAKGMHEAILDIVKAFQDLKKKMF